MTKVDNVEQLSKDREDVVKILQDKNLTFQDRTVALCKLNSEYGDLARRLQSYQDRLGGEEAKELDGKRKAQIAYSLYREFFSICDLSFNYYPIFKTKFDIINLFFYVYKDGAFEEFKIYTDCVAWSSSRASERTYHALLTVICAFCDPFTRKENLKGKTLKYLITPEKTEFTENMIGNILQYYQAK